MQKQSTKKHNKIASLCKVEVYCNKGNGRSSAARAECVATSTMAQKLDTSACRGAALREQTNWIHLMMLSSLFASLHP